MAMEKQCTFLIFDESVSRAEMDELAAGLENADVAVKSATLRKIIMLILNGRLAGTHGQSKFLVLAKRIRSATKALRMRG